MLRKHKMLISIFCVCLTLFFSIYIVFIRDWSKRTSINENWLKYVVDEINEAEDLSEIAERLAHDGNVFKVDKPKEDSEGICLMNDLFNFCIFPNEDNNGHGPFFLKKEEDLDEWLDEEYGKFRPIFNLMCRNYEFDGGKVWVSPNIRSKNVYGFTENTDEIMAVLFCKKYTVTLWQDNWGGDKAFEKSVWIFYSHLRND